jgi:hypothetical protein
MIPFWKSKDGLRIPKAGTDARKEWDQGFKDRVAQVFAGGDAAKLRPVRVPVDEPTGSNMPVNKDRLRLYRRMAVAEGSLPPVVVRRSGIGWNLIDGNHRQAAAKAAGHSHMQALELIDPVKKSEEYPGFSEEQRFTPAFRHRVTGQIHITPGYHDPEMLPEGKNFDSGDEDMPWLKNYEDGFVNSQGVFHNRAQAAEAVKVRYPEAVERGGLQAEDLPMIQPAPVQKSEDLQKSKKDALQMYQPTHPGAPEAKAHTEWAYNKMPNENWSLWTVRHHREKPQDFTPKVKADLEHFAGSQHIPEIAKVRFEKGHDLKTGMGMLKTAEKQYKNRMLSNSKLVTRPSTATEVMKFPDGYSWWNLGVPSCAEEGKALDHCGNEGTRNPNEQVLSLRREHKIGKTKYYEPHLTFVKDGNTLGQMKGRANAKPPAEYHEKISKLLETGLIPVGGGYAPEQNFHVKDLPEDLYQKAAEKNPALKYYRTGDTSPEVVDKLLETGGVGVKRSLSDAPGLDIRHQRQLYDSGDLDVYAGLASNPTLSPELQNNFANHLDSHLRGKVAANPSLSPELQSVLANDIVGRVQEHLARNPNLLPELHPVLARSITSFARAALAERGDISPEIQGVLAQEENPAIREALAENVNFDPQHHESLLRTSPGKEKDFALSRARLANHPRLSVAAQKEILRKPNSAAALVLAKNPALDPKFHEGILKNPAAQRAAYELAKNPSLDAKWQKELATKGNFDQRHAVAVNPRLDSTLHSLLAQDEFPSVRLGLASNEGLNLEAQHLLARDKNDDVRAGLAGNPNFDPSLHGQLMYDSSAQVRHFLAAHPNLHPKVMSTWASKSDDPQLRSYLARRGDLTPEDFRWLENDPDAHVRERLSRNPSYQAYKASLTKSENPTQTPDTSNPAFHASLVSHPDPSVREELASQPNLAPIHQAALADDEESDVRSALAKNPNLHPSLHRVLIEDQKSSVLGAMAERSDLSPETSQRLKANTDEYWRNIMDMAAEAAAGDPYLEGDDWNYYSKSIPQHLHLQGRTRENLAGKPLHGRPVKMVNVADLSDIKALEWNPQRSASVEAGYKAGDLMPPIDIGLNQRGGRELGDGNHRLAIARKLGIGQIPVTFSEDAADHTLSGISNSPHPHDDAMWVDDPYQDTGLTKAIDPKDFGAVLKATTHKGRDMVDHKPDLTAHPPEMEPEVNYYRKDILGGPNTFKKATAKKSGIGGGITRKAVYQSNLKFPGEEQPMTFMVKPYHEGIEKKVSTWQRYPIQGWAEMTNQALYHAAGLGHLHQKVHVTEHQMAQGDKTKIPPMSDKIRARLWSDVGGLGNMPNQALDTPHYDRAKPEGEALYNKHWNAYMGAVRNHTNPVKIPGKTQPNEPALVVHVSPGMMSAAKAYEHNWTVDDEKHRDSLRKIATMDFLTNNMDRHGGNLMFAREDGQPFAVDHSRSFQYTNIPKHKWDLNQEQVNRLSRSGEMMRDRFSDYVNPARNPNKSVIGPFMPEGEMDARTDGRSDMTTLKAWQPIFEDWWPKNRDNIVKTMQSRLQQIRDPEVKAHINRNFMSRVKFMDDRAHFGLDNHGLDWYNDGADWYMPGQKSDEENTAEAKAKAVEQGKIDDAKRQEYQKEKLAGVLADHKAKFKKP